MAKRMIGHFLKVETSLRQSDSDQNVVKRFTDCNLDRLVLSCLASLFRVEPVMF
jgi:hypothetical protein